jgi:hypothetical protein
MLSLSQHQTFCSTTWATSVPAAPAMPTAQPALPFAPQAQVPMQHTGFAVWAQGRQPQSLTNCFLPPATVGMAQMQPMPQMPLMQQIPRMPQMAVMPQMQQMPQMAAMQLPPVAHGMFSLRGIPGNVNYDNLPVGLPLYQGRSKTVLPLLVPQTGQLSGHVLVVERNPLGRATPHEVKHLADLQAMGIPVTPIQSIGSFRGHAARMMPQMVRTDLSPDGLLSSPFVTPATLRSLQYLSTRLDSHGIGFEGLQLLMHPADGSLYVSAPAGNLVGAEAFESGANRRQGSVARRSGMKESVRHAIEVLRQRFSGKKA